MIIIALCLCIGWTVILKKQYNNSQLQRIGPKLWFLNITRAHADCLPRSIYTQPAKNSKTRMAITWILDCGNYSNWTFKIIFPQIRSMYTLTVSNHQETRIHNLNCFILYSDRPTFITNFNNCRSLIK